MEIKLKCSSFKLKVSPKEVVKNFFDLNLGSVFTELIEVDETLESIAFSLLFNTSRNTNILLSKNIGQDVLNNSENLVAIADSISSDIRSFLEQEVTITPEFFTDIIKHNPTYLTKSFLLFRKYLELLNIEIPAGINYNYYISFRNQLIIEYQSKKDKYSKLIEYFNNPIFTENKKISNQLVHYKEIGKYYTNQLQPDVDESVETLKNLYIEPYFSVFNNNLKKSESENNHTSFNSLKKNFSIHSFLVDFFLSGKKHSKLRENYNMLFVLGQPGQGKTSFCYKLIYDYLEAENGLPKVPLYFLKIRSLSTKDFISDTFQTINSFLNQNIDIRNEECILVLDGLDEAFMSGGLRDNDLRNLYDRLNKTANSNKNLKLILTSRLNYLSIEDSCVDGSLVIQLDELTDEQIKKYAKKFNHFYPDNKLTSNIDDLLKNKNQEHIKELLRQAVLLYFIAIADVDIKASDSKILIYRKIFEILSKRSWDKNGQLSYIKSNLKTDPEKYSSYLRTYIRRIAFEIYQSKQLYITLEQLSQLDTTKWFIKKCFDSSIEMTEDRIKEINKYLLISFYFQESNNNNQSDTAIEFFHNSLWEYLTAEYIWETNKTILLNKDSDGDIVIINKEKYFEYLNRIIGNKFLQHEIIENLKEIIENEDKEIKSLIFELSKPLFLDLIEHDFLLSYERNKNELTSNEKRIQLFRLFWIFYYQSNLTGGTKIEAKSKLNNYLFNESSYYSYDEEYKNITFSDELMNAGIGDCEFSNVNFYVEFIFNVMIEGCLFKHVEFEGHMANSSFYNNRFKKVIFSKCYFSDIFFRNNTFDNCKFIDVYVEDDQWLNNLSNNNIIDEETLKNHTIEKELLNDKNEFQIKYKGKQ